MKAILEPIDRLSLLTPWWQRLLVLVPVTICFALIVSSLSYLPGHWKLLSPAFGVSYCGLVAWRSRIASRRSDRLAEA